MEFKGTKGAWEVEEITGEKNNLVYCKIKTKEKAVGFAGVYSKPKDLPLSEALANACLIAAAPELLEEHITDLGILKEWLEDISHYDSSSELYEELSDMIHAKEKVIKKALEG